MSSGNIDIVMTGDEKDLIKAQAKVLKSQDEVIGKYKKMLKEARGTARGARSELERFAESTKKINRTPAERYAQTMVKLKAALQAGLISQTTFNRAVARARQETGEAFGAGSVKRIAAWALGLGAARTALSKISQLLSDIKQRSDELSQTQMSDEAALAQLGQLADNAADMRRLVTLSQDVFGRGGAATQAEAARTVFALESVGQIKALETFSRLRETQIVAEADELAAAVQTLIRNLGEKETGGARRLVSKAFIGAEFGGKNTPEAILTAASRSAGSARALGFSDEEVIAATALAAESIGPAEEGGTAVASLLKSIEKEAPELAGRSLQETLRNITQKGLSGAGLFELFGREEAVRAFRILEQNQDAFRRNLAELEGANVRDVVGERLAAVESIPLLRAQQIRRRQKNLTQLAEEDRGIRATLADAMLAEQRRRGVQRGESQFFIEMRERRLQLQRTLFGDRATMQVEGTPLERQFGPTMQERRGETQGALAGVMTAMLRSAFALESASDKIHQASEQMKNQQSFTNQQRRSQQQHGGAIEAN